MVVTPKLPPYWVDLLKSNVKDWFRVAPLGGLNPAKVRRPPFRPTACGCTAPAVVNCRTCTPPTCVPFTVM